MKTDLTTKVLLTVIALFLGILVVRPWMTSTTANLPLGLGTQSAVAAETDNLTNANKIGIRTELASILRLSDKSKVRSIHVIDKAQSFLVQYDDVMMLYTIKDVTK